MNQTTYAETSKVGYGQATEAPEAPRRNVPFAVDVIAAEAESIERLTEELWERLLPVAMPIGGMLPKERDEKSPPKCPLAGTLGEIGQRLQCHSATLRQMIDALEV